jgi:hypothetical protein
MTPSGAGGRPFRPSLPVFEGDEKNEKMLKGS